MVNAPSSKSLNNVAIGYVSKAHGVRGAVNITLKPLSWLETDSQGKILAVTHDSLYLSFGTHVEIASNTFEVASVKSSNRGQIVSFTTVTTREQAEQLRGNEVFIEYDIDEDFPAAALVGLSVFQENSLVGKVSEVIHGAQSRLEVRSETEKFLVPLVPELVRIEASGIVVSLPEGWPKESL